ncbi:MAG: alpha-L-glutamate ligase [Rickettsiales bacterium]|nr:alpha-L-glutamate ligase [Rickettsiales bacterium]
MECWILFDGETEGTDPGAYEARRLIEAGRRKDLDVRVIRPEQFDLVVTRDDRKSVLIDGNVVRLPDFVLTRISGDVNYFTMAVLRHLERLGVPTYNRSAPIDAVKDKLHSLQILAESGIPVPVTMLGKFPVDVDLVKKVIGFPVVVKTLVGTHGNGVFLCNDESNFEDLMQLIRQTGADTQLLFQQFIASSKGRDLRVMVINGKAVAAMERRATDGSFKANFSRGGMVKEFKLTPAIEELAIETARVLDLDIAGIDILFDGRKGYKICEANSAPDFRGLESCCDISVADEILDAMISELRKNKEISENITDFGILRRKAKFAS